MTDPKVVLILNEILKRLKTISAARDSTKWFTSPGTVELGPTMGSLNKPGPAIFLELTDWSDKKLMASQHEATITLKVYGYLEHSENPQTETHRLAYDIIKVFAEADGDRLLSGSPATPLVIDIGVEDYTAGFEFVEQVGRGEVFVTARATFRWTHSAP